MLYASIPGLRIHSVPFFIPQTIELGISLGIVYTCGNCACMTLFSSSCCMTLLKWDNVIADNFSLVLIKTQVYSKDLCRKTSMSYNLIRGLEVQLEVELLFGSVFSPSFLKGRYRGFGLTFGPGFDLGFGSVFCTSFGGFSTDWAGISSSTSFPGTFSASPSLVFISLASPSSIFSSSVFMWTTSSPFLSRENKDSQQALPAAPILVAPISIISHAHK